MELPASLLRWARAHHQLVTRQVWIAHGLASRSFDRAAERGELVRLGRSVAALRGATLDVATRIAAAVLEACVGVMASHRSSAFLWNAPVRGDRPIELITLDRGTVRIEGAIVHRPRDMVDLRPIVRQRIPTTNPLRTLTDIGATDPAVVGSVLESFLIDRFVTPAVVAVALDRHRGPGHRGVRALERALDALVLTDKPPDSILEPAMARLFVAHGIEGWTFHPIVEGIEVGFAFLDAGVVVEVDGWSYHHEVDVFENDRRRDPYLVSKGWSVMRFSWTRVTKEGRSVAREVSDAVSARR